MSETGPNGSLADQAYYRIREKILKGILPFGAPLSRRKLAAQLGMSFVPVSEALKRLEGDSLVESRPRVGTRVRIPNAQDIRGHYVVREALESQAARLFALKASPDEREELKRMAGEVDGLFGHCVPAGFDPDYLYKVHLYHHRLHMRIAECTGCRALCEAVEKNQILILNWLYDTASGPRSLPETWHGRLMEVVAGSDPIAADEVMREHVRYGMDEVLRRLENTVSGWDGADVDALQTRAKTVKFGRM